ncbi:MAG TPA: GWxTD domain-containing protein [Acidobacteriaceae bacterium]
MLFRPIRVPLLLACLLLLNPFSSRAAQSSKNLSPEFRHWINEEVTYIISSEEKKQFLSLANDTERDNFIKNFWSARNPDPSSEINSYKEEHYRRLAYANQHYGNLKAQDGWHTDQGMIYILLGEPQQLANYPAARNMRPLQIWFYQAKVPELPTHFNIVFYKRSIGEPYTLYSPYQDGPSRLVADNNAINNQDASIRVIQKSLGDEVARTALSLIPTEPVDLKTYTPSLISDVMLSTIRGLADNPLEKQRLALYRSRETVTASIFSNSSAIDVATMTTRDSQGRETVSYLVRNQGPNSALIADRPNKGLGYSLTLRTVVATTTGKPVYEQQDAMENTVSADDADRLRKQRFAAEGRLALVPGSYDVEVTLTNNLNLEAQRWRNHIEVPDARPEKLGLSSLLVYKAPTAVPDPAGRLPFSLAGLRFTPQAAQSATIHAGESIPLIFQIWLPTPKAGAPSVKAVHLHYLYGSVAMGGKPLSEFDEDVDASNADAAGNLVTGHTMPTADLSVGSYQLVVRATVDGDPTPAFSTLTVRVVPPDVAVDQWTAHSAEQTAAEAADDLKRGLAAEALGHSAEAEACYGRALDADPAQLRALARLAAVLSVEHKTAELAKLSDATLVTSALPPDTLMLIAGAVRDGGDLKKAIRLLTGQLALQAPSAPMYELLASLYDSAGDRDKAGTLREQAKKLSTTPAAKPQP